MGLCRIACELALGAIGRTDSPTEDNNLDLLFGVILTPNICSVSKPPRISRVIVQNLTYLPLRRLDDRKTQRPKRRINAAD